MTDVELDSNFLIEERADYIDEDTIKNNTIRSGAYIPRHQTYSWS